MFIHSIIPRALKNQRNARAAAISSNRLDICAAQFAMWFHLCGRCDINHKVCLEVGSGWVLSHAIICYLLGAKHIFATDIYPNAHPPALYAAIHGAIPSVVRDTLAPFCDHEEIRDRLDVLLTIDKFSFRTLEDLGIEYIAPIDLARDTFDHPIDFIYSNSVMEHIPTEDVQPVLKKMSQILNPSGCMIHAIHLEDHNSIGVGPFDFYAEPDENYSRVMQTNRGNRIRKSQWLKNIQSVDDLEVKILYEFKRKTKKIPEVIAPSIRYVDENDLRTTHIGLFLSKKNRPVEPSVIDTSNPFLSARSPGNQTAGTRLPVSLVESRSVCGICPRVDAFAK